MSDFAEIKRQLLSGKKKSDQLPFAQGLSTGSTLLNLAMTGNPHVGMPPGGFYFIVGDSRSGKTFISLTSLAEASLDPKFADYRFIFDNAENGAMMDFVYYFGQKMVDRLEPPSRDGDGQPVYSSTVESFYYHLDDALADGRPFIYVLDSMDSINSDEDNSKFAERKEAFRKGKTVTGSYALSKAKINSACIRVVNNKLPQTGSILIVISQTRANLGFGFEEKTRAGGLSLRFYAQWELWSSVAGRIEKEFAGKKRQIGTHCKIKVVKNRFTGWEGTIKLPIYRKYGIDDLGSLVDWLIEEKHWSKQGASIIAPEFNFKGTQEKLLGLLQEPAYERRLKQVAIHVWTEIDRQCQVSRKRRYES